ncbi:transposase [Holospora curviuscula]|uniref:Tc1-like transposase DDE domain-containing protein n=1 Tax=Holospora curviuscula TaxID=1082868 RepID=A0A2S5REF4_9PROT|nr:transposase [Holospora curviuscula]PPE05694.1 hypothetical protein HCUR_00168 [Holospora curviuscula]
MGSTLGATGLLTSSVNIAVLICWVKKMFLTNIPENRGIVLDNAAFYQGKAVRKMIKNAGHTLFYLPPYSLDLNAKQIRRSTHCSMDVLLSYNCSIVRSLYTV